MKLNVIMPMGGGGTRFGNHGFNVPKPLIEIYGKPFFYWATQSLVKNIEIESLTFVVLKEHIEKFTIDQRIKEFYPDARINVIPEVLPGAVLTCKAGVINIENDKPIIFNDCDHLFLCSSFYEFCKNDEFETIDGGLLTFKSHDPKFSFVAYDENGYVNHTVEKRQSVKMRFVELIILEISRYLKKLWRFIWKIVPITSFLSVVYIM